MKKVHFHVLKFAQENPGFTLTQLEAEFPDAFAWINREIQHSRLFQADGVGDSRRYYLSFEDSAKLLEQEELREARASSKRAMFVAITSILLTLFIAITEILTTKEVEIVAISQDAAQAISKPVPQITSAPTD